MSRIPLIVTKVVTDFKRNNPHLYKEENKNMATKNTNKRNNFVTGNLIAITHWAKVTGVTSENGQPVLNVQDVDRNARFSVIGQDLIDAASSADTFVETKTVTKTAAAELLVSSHNKPFTVCFEKQEGGERVLRGRLLSAEPLLGRSHVEDLDISSGNRMRLVDHRTIRYLIVDGIKHTVK